MDLAEAIALIRPIPDYPSPGILFQDITPLLRSAEGFSVVTETLAAIDHQANIVAGVEARGFIIGSAIAATKRMGFVPIRKKGKLPHETISRSYGLEYGRDEIEVHSDAFNSSNSVLLVDDVLATGGTLEAAIHLIQSTGAKVSAIVVLLEIMGLPGRERIKQSFPNITIHALVTK
jgi:adenine phosphoribosyltransferase